MQIYLEMAEKELALSLNTLLPEMTCRFSWCLLLLGVFFAWDTESYWKVLNWNFCYCREAFWYIRLSRDKTNDWSFDRSFLLLRGHEGPLVATIIVSHSTLPPSPRKLVWSQVAEPSSPNYCTSSDQWVSCELWSTWLRYRIHKGGCSDEDRVSYREWKV